LCWVLCCFGRSATTGRSSAAYVEQSQLDIDKIRAQIGQTRVRIKDFAASAAESAGGDNVIKAPMHGRVLEILASIGERVVFGQRLAVIEAMKMEHTLRAPFAAVVKELPVSTGAQVVEGAPIMVLEPVETVDPSSE